MQPRDGAVAAAVGQRRAVRFGRRINQQRPFRPDVAPGHHQAERPRGGDAQALRFQPAATLGGQLDYRFAGALLQRQERRVFAAGDAQPAALAAGVGARMHPQLQGLAGAHRLGADRGDAERRKLQMRREQSGMRGAAQQQRQHQRRIVVVVQRAQQHRHQQRREKQAEAGGQHVDAAAVESHRQRFGRARFDPFRRAAFDPLAHAAVAHAPLTCPSGCLPACGEMEERASVRDTINPPPPRAGSISPARYRRRRRHRRPADAPLLR